MSNTSRAPDCRKCDQGHTDVYRLIVRSELRRPRYLLHAHRDDTLEAIFLRLCEEFPSEWAKDVVYFFYIDIGATYYAVEHSFWLRDKDQVLVTTVESVDLLPQVSMNAVHASLRPHIELQPHQEQGIMRMISMERTNRGGILADDMGLGKTLQTLVTIMRQQPKLDIRACTLIVVPSRGVADQWAEEIRTKTNYGSLPYFIYSEETMSLLEEPFFRVVITTYDRLRAEFRNRAITGMASPLIDTHWHRIVLDESHKVRTLKSMLTESVLELQATYRWCLTGTPLQNDITELYPIFAFLRIELSARHKQDVDYISTVLKDHMVRRTKKSLQTALSILPQHEQRVCLEFTDAERALYDYLEHFLYKQIRKYRLENHSDAARSTASLLYLRLKQVCGHHMILLRKFPDLIPTIQQGESDRLIARLNSDDAESAERINLENEETELNEAFDVIESFHSQFQSDYQLDINALQKLPFLQHSTKVAWLLDFLKRTLRNNRTDKIVVVTQFVDLLQIVSGVLSSLNIKHNCYHGDMTNTARMVSLRQFNHQPEIRVMLLSLKAGGVGLNLQRANHMVILDRWWNPATMDQAIARIHRMTQSKQTFVYTVTIKETLEEELIDSVLRKKSELFKTVVEEEEDEDEAMEDMPMADGLVA